jgi:hypothetical protein
MLSKHFLSFKKTQMALALLESKIIWHTFINIGFYLIYFLRSERRQDQNKYLLRDSVRTIFGTVAFLGTGIANERSSWGWRKRRKTRGWRSEGLWWSWSRLAWLKLRHLWWMHKTVWHRLTEKLGWSIICPSSINRLNGLRPILVRGSEAGTSVTGSPGPFSENLKSIKIFLNWTVPRFQPSKFFSLFITEGLLPPNNNDLCISLPKRII